MEKIKVGIVGTGYTVGIAANHVTGLYSYRTIRYNPGACRKVGGREEIEC